MGFLATTVACHKVVTYCSLLNYGKINFLFFCYYYVHNIHTFLCVFFCSLFIHHYLLVRRRIGRPGQSSSSYAIETQCNILFFVKYMIVVCRPISHIFFTRVCNEPDIMNDNDTSLCFAMSAPLF